MELLFVPRWIPLSRASGFFSSQHGLMPRPFRILRAKQPSNVQIQIQILGNSKKAGYEKRRGWPLIGGRRLHFCVSAFPGVRL